MRRALVFALIVGCGAAAWGQPYPPSPPSGRVQGSPLPPAPPPPNPYEVPPSPGGSVMGRGSTLLSFELGAAVPLSDVDLGAIGGGKGVNGGAGPILGGRYIYQLGPQLGVGGEIGFLYRSGSNSTSLIQFANTSPSGSSWLVMGDARYAWRPGRRVRPYVVGSVGVHRTHEKIDSTPQSGFSWSDTLTDETRTIVDDTRWGLATALRAGVDFAQSDTMSLGMEIGWIRLNNAKYSATAQGQALGLANVSGPISILAITGHVGFGWR